MAKDKSNKHLPSKLLKHIFLRDGVEVSYELPSAARQVLKNHLGVKPEDMRDAMEEARKFVHELVDEAFAKDTVSHHARRELGEAHGFDAAREQLSQISRDLGDLMHRRGHHGSSSAGHSSHDHDDHGHHGHHHGGH